MTESTARIARLSRREWTLVALGVAVWIALALGGVWFVHQLTRPRDGCGSTTEAPTNQARGSTAPGNAFSVLTGQGRCK